MGAPADGYVSGLHARWLVQAPDCGYRGHDATLVFADISGFTAMSERLARHGKIGSEEATDVVNRAFACLLEATSRAGGELLKFGGDAVLAHFAGPGHEHRGAWAARAMQAGMRDLRRLRTTAGFVNLRVSAGVASGAAHLFLAGASPRELLVAGPLATEVVTLESAASAGQVLAGAGTLAALPAACAGREIGPGRLLRAVPERASEEILEVHPAGFDARLALPPHLHDHEPGDGEHRFASIAFVQFSGVGALLDQSGPEAVAAALDELVCQAAQACAAHGVTFVSTDVDRDGGKIILAAGAPTASADDEDRLLHALRSIVSVARPLPVRAGVNRGRVFMVDIGPPQRRVWSVMGDAVNLAARVMSRAAPGQLLASASVLQRVRDGFERTPIEPFPVKGKTGLVHAEIVGAASGARRASVASGGLLVGRERELIALMDGLAAARSGRHVAFEVVGEPGIGKSRLLEALLDATDGLLTVMVAGGPYAALSPYRALQAPLRRLLGAAADESDAAVRERLRARVEQLDPRLAPWLPLIGIPFGVHFDATAESQAVSPEFQRTRLHIAIGRLAELMLAGQPVLVVVEDAHWLDDASGDLLTYLAGQRRTAGSCHLLTRRDVPEGMTLAGRSDVRVMALEPLDPAAAETLLAQDAEQHTPLPPGTEAKLIERAGGNPLLLQELLSAARAGAPADALPDNVEALVVARIDTLPRRDREILRQAAVLGARVSTPLLADLVDLDAPAVDAALGRLGDFLVSEDDVTVRFRHALLREAAYEALPYRRRRRLHARAGELTEALAGDAADQQAELLSIHFHAAHLWEQSYRYGSMAADQALGRAAPIEAAGFLGSAIEAGRALRVDALQLARLAERQGEALRLSGRFEQAGVAFTEARRHARGHPLTEAGLCLLVGRLRERSKHQTQALRWLTRGMGLLEGEAGAQADHLRAEIWLARAIVRLHTGHTKRSVECAENAAAIAEASGDRMTLAKAYNALHWAHTEMASPERERYRGLALPIFEELGDHEWQGKTLNNLGIDAYWSGRWDEAIAFYERGRAMLERVGDVVEAAVLLNNIAEIHSDQGHLDEAEAELLAVLSTFRAAGFHLGAGLVHSNLGRVASRRRDAASAAEMFAQARETLTAIGAEALVLELDTREAELCVLTGEPERALRLAGSIRDTANAQHAQPALLALNQRVVAYAKLQLGDVEAACVRLRESIEIARSVGAVYEEARSLEALGHAGKGAEAREAAAAGAALLERLGVLALEAVVAG